MYAYAGGGPPHYASPPTYLQPHPPPGPSTHNLQVPPVAMGHHQEINPVAHSHVAHYSKKRRYVFTPRETITKCQRSDKYPISFVKSTLAQ